MIWTSEKDMVGKKDLTGKKRIRKRDKGKALAGKSTLNRLELTPTRANKRSRYKKITVNHRAVDAFFTDIFIQSYDSLCKHSAAQLSSVVRKFTFCQCWLAAVYENATPISTSEVRFVSGQTNEKYAIVGMRPFDAANTVIFRPMQIGTTMHEFCHSFANPVVKKHLEKLRPVGKKFFEIHGPAMRMQGYL